MILGILSTLFILFLWRIVQLYLSEHKHRSFHDVVPYLQADAPKILAELLDPVAERHLAVNVGPEQFRKEQLKRILLLRECLNRRSQNCVICQEWGGTELKKSRLTGNRTISGIANILVESSAGFRMAMFSIGTQLYFWQLKLTLFPFVQVPQISSLRKIDDFDVLRSYEEIKQAALNLAMLCGEEYNDLAAAFEQGIF